MRQRLCRGSQLRQQFVGTSVAPSRHAIQRVAHGTGGAVHPAASGALRAVVLVAGRGSRLRDRTARIPKCLVDVNGTPILVSALERLEAAGVCEALLVVGYLADMVRRRLGTALGRMRISYRENRDFQNTNTSRSLWLGLDGMDEDILVLEGDVVFDQHVLDDFLVSPHVDATLVQRWNPALDGSVVQVDADGSVHAWVHKKDRPPGFSLAGTYKTVNIHRFSRRFVRERLRPALWAEVTTDGGREPIETSFARIVQEGGRIHAVEVCGRWCEIDDEADLRTAEAMFDGASDAHR